MNATGTTQDRRATDRHGPVRGVRHLAGQGARLLAEPLIQATRRHLAGLSTEAVRRHRATSPWGGSIARAALVPAPCAAAVHHAAAGPALPVVPVVLVAGYVLIAVAWAVIRRWFWWRARSQPSRDLRWLLRHAESWEAAEHLAAALAERHQAVLDAHTRETTATGVPRSPRPGGRRSRRRPEEELPDDRDRRGTGRGRRTPNRPSRHDRQPARPYTPRHTDDIPR